MGNERPHFLPLLDAVRRRTGMLGRPRKRLQIFATAKGDNSKDLRQQLRAQGIRAQMPKRVWKTKKPRGRPITIDVPRFKTSGH
jgi:hypothetical protein